jgi:hypothetical protein
VFKKGYTDGYTCSAYANPYNYGSKQHKDYSEGFNMGQGDYDIGKPERYRYVKTTVVSATAWPFPNP